MTNNPGEAGVKGHCLCAQLAPTRVERTKEFFINFKLNQILFFVVKLNKIS